MIRGTFCDLALKLDGTLALLVEVKAIGLDLKEQYVKQAVDYAANQGVEWVALTNGALWRVYSVTFSKPIEHELVVNLDLLSLNPRNSEHIDLLGLLAKEGWKRAQLGEYHAQRQVLNRFILGALILSDPALDVLRREIRRLAEVRIDTSEIRSALEADVLKRDILEGDKAEAARKQVSKAAAHALRSSKMHKESQSKSPDSALETTPKTGSEV